MRAQFARRRFCVEMPVRLAGEGGFRREVGLEAVRQDDFGRTNAFDACRQLFRCHFAYAEFTAGQVEPSQSRILAGRGQCQQQCIALVVEQRCVRQRAGRDDARDGALDRPLAGGRVTDLFADHHRLAEFDEAREVLLDGVVGHAGHLDRYPGALAARGQGDVEQSGGLFGVFVEQLVEIAHAIKKQRIFMLLFQLDVLLHHRGVR